MAYQAQRKKGSFHKKQLTHIIYGGKQKFQTFMKFQQTLENNETLKYNPSILNLSRKDFMSQMGKKLIKFHQINNLPIDGTNEPLKILLFTYSMPLSLHGIMFLKTLQNLCDDQQRKMFYQPALSGQIIGCYAQTQLAHGSDIQNLMTTATYDKQTQTFIINTPSVGATKWWIGDLGVYCNHAGLFAQLIINGKNYGLHSFLVPIRDPKTNKAFQGVQVGDIGPKFGFQTKDNGFVIFKNYRIPRRNMLMRYHVVSKQGVYSLQGDQKISYATMLMTRSNLTYASFAQYSKIVTIAVKYSLLRTQFKNNNQTQIPIIDYITQQQKIIPRVSQLFASFYTSRSIAALSNFVFNQSQLGNFERLNEAHILTSATKAILSYEVLRGAEILRRACGGHGFHLYNGMITVQLQYSPVFTLEGQYTVLMLQVARFLFKSLNNLQKGKKLAESIDYLQALKQSPLKIDLKNESDLQCPFFIKKVLQYISCELIKGMGLKMQEGLKQGLKEKQVWDKFAGISLSQCATFHAVYINYQFFLNGVRQIKDQKLRIVMMLLVSLYGIQKIIQRAGKIYETGVISPQFLQAAYRRRLRIFELIRPELLTLVQSFEYNDEVLQSAIAHSNGKPYQNLIKWAKEYNNLNQKDQRDQIIAAIKKAKQQLRPQAFL